ncbi:nucleotide sugar dehydrogenase [Aliikangiella coralliicola]|uniref:Nucleotide sugar dehydrogenase n=1 Tax=Aliikangiella coralliicola TaxID=2592383 RepID=A0A545TSW3_9GAMM|nr:nucleotide sugar dehydrogenase [Aliikangiella coralliicola]TQV80231.1 nucleotide sugar dehydrogenase [Aliikangiella coralliicola]
MDRKISVIGLGYVGLPVAVAFGNSHQVVGFDLSSERISELKNGKDRTLEVSDEELTAADIHFTCDPVDLKKADFHIVAVPTPINHARQPDLRPMLSASKTIGQQLKKGDIVVFESTVYPGATEEDCVPILEAESGLKCGEDFTVGYSPERINPGDKEHTFTKITKVVSGQDQKTLDIVADVYSSVVTAGVHKAATIKVAEAAKVIENTQRDLNIALMNELAVIFEKMNIDTLDVLEAAGTKWNFLPFRPGLVGGHCIGVDPYYLTYKAEQVGYRPEVIQAGRRINDNMSKLIVGRCVKEMIKKDKKIKGARVGILGLTFKEDCPDLRNSKVEDLITEFRSYGVEPLIHDAMADSKEAMNIYGVELSSMDSMKDCDLILVAVAHKEYKAISAESFASMLTKDGSLFDIKGILPRKDLTALGIDVWRI